MIITKTKPLNIKMVIYIYIYICVCVCVCIIGGNNGINHDCHAALWEWLYE